MYVEILQYNYLNFILTQVIHLNRRKWESENYSDMFSLNYFGILFATPVKLFSSNFI